MQNELENVEDTDLKDLIDDTQTTDEEKEDKPVEKEMQDLLKKQEEGKTDKYQCSKCGSIIAVPKGEIPEKCYADQGGCGKRHKKFKLIGEDGKPIEPPSKKTKEEQKKEAIKEAKDKEQEVDETLKLGRHEDLKSDVFLEMDAYVDMVANGITYGAIIEGAGGTGKTWRVINHLTDVDYAYTDSFTTPQAFYIWLYANRHKEVLVVDDVAGLTTNDKVLAFLKGALWEINGKRIIHYMTTKPMQDEYGNYVPNAFILDARMIIITNKLNKKNPHMNAVLTRVNYCKVEIDYEELMNILEQVAKKDYPGIPLEERMEVLNFIRNNTSEVNNNLNIRSLIKAFQQKIYSNKIENPTLWKQLVMVGVVQRNPAMVVVYELMNDTSFGTEEERIAEFKNRTGRSRPTYFRLKDQMKLMGDKVEKQKK